MTLEEEIRSALNRCSADNGSNTPDFILAEYLINCLDAFDTAVTARATWYGDNDETDDETDDEDEHD